METKDLLLIGAFGLLAYLIYKKEKKQKTCGCDKCQSAMAVAPSYVPTEEDFNKWDLQNNTHQESYASIQAKQTVSDRVNSQEKFFANFFSIEVRPNFN